MRIIGLTGGIACGKSTVAKIFEQLGSAVIDADRVARDVVATGSVGLQRVVDRFGREILDAAGGLDRAKLRGIIFKDPRAKKDLEAILHPLIGKESAKRMAAVERDGARICLYEAALLVETGSQRMYDGLIVVVAKRDIQIARLIRRDDCTREEAQAALDSQMDLGEKASYADWVIDNSADLSALGVKVGQVHRELEIRADR